ncbi:MAG: alpha/beta hydrolase fold domain-containing protein [Phycisphaera sp.]|nr:alpha/beta hydrolase fold domain-containing protein [Phycisphaera sp.]
MQMNPKTRRIVRPFLTAGVSVLCLAFSTAVLAQQYGRNVPEPTKVGIAYGPDERNVMDLWLAEGEGPRPVVVNYHSGGWYEGSKERLGRDLGVKQLLDAGISVVAVNYRLIPQNPTTPQTIDANVPPPVDAPMSDARRALQFVRYHARDWNIDPNRVGLSGGSAGGCTSLWLAFHDDMADPKSDDPVLRQSTRVTCAAVGWPQTTLDPAQGREWIPDLQYGAHAFGMGSVDDALARRNQLMPWIKEYSPAAWVSKDDPQVCLIFSKPPDLGNGGGDPTHSTNFGAGLKAICDQTGVECVLFYKGVEKVKYNNATAYLIEKLKGE